MKSLYLHYFSVCILLFVIALLAGCAGVVKTTPASLTVEPTTPIVSTTLVTMNACPVPKLILNNSQEITKLKNAPGIRFTGRTATQDSRPGTVPSGGVLYYDAGFTRIFDSAGKQILFVNDSESVAFIPAGYVVPVTYIVDDSTASVMSPSQDNNVTYVYQEGDDTCIAAIIRTPGAFTAPPIPPH